MFEKQLLLKKLLMTLAGKRHYKKLIKSCSAVEETQRKLMMDIIHRNKNTAFGKDHNFNSISNIKEFQEQVPIRDFEEHRPYINRIIAGESDILFPGRPISYSMTSGTTAEAKYIPISETYQQSFTKLNRIWFYSCLRGNPEIFNGRTLTTVSPAEEGVLSDGVSYGSLSGKSYLNCPPILKTTFTSPYPVIDIADYQKKYYAIMRGALACNVTYVVCASPTNLIKLHQTVIDNFDDMVKDIRNGTLKEDILDIIPEEKRAEVRRYYKPAPERADELEQLWKLHGKNLLPAHYFPNIKVINTWKQGNFKRVFPKVRELFAKTTNIRAMGYQASEARAGIVLENDWDYSLLAHTSYFYEFIEENERESENPNIKLLHELEEGKRYYILITNDSGLFRYDINDLISVCGHYKQSPKIMFIQKGAGITSITGEKLSEQQVITAVEHASEKLKISVPFFLMFCDLDKMSYTKYVEFASDIEEDMKKSFITVVDTHLSEINPEYRVKRGSGRLDQPSIKELKPLSHENYKQILIKNNYARDGQFKDLYLQTKDHVREILESLTK